MATAREPFNKCRVKPEKLKGLRRDYTPAPKHVTRPYLLGVLHDATKRKSTYRIASKSRVYCQLLEEGIKNLGMSAWVYREGSNRNVWVTEFSKSLLTGADVKTRQDKIDYLRGYFDAEGGIAKTKTVRYYLYFAQKNKSDLEQVWRYLEELGIACGRMHNPSKKVDPHYWRFYISAKSYNDFARVVGSNHPEKFKFLLEEEIVHATRK